MKRRKKNQKVLYVAVAAIAIGIAIVAALLATGNFQMTGLEGTRYIQYSANLFGWYECKEATETTRTSSYQIPSSGVSLSCPEGKAESCVVRATTPDLGVMVFERRFRYEITRSNGLVEKKTIPVNSGYSQTIDFPKLLVGDTIDIWYERSYVISWNAINGATYYMEYTPFIIWKRSVCSGSDEFTTVDQGCRISTFNDVITKDTTGKAITYSTSTLGFHKSVNFIDCAVDVPEYSIVTYNSQKAYCSGGKLYGFETIETQSTTYKVANLNNLIATKRCCPGTSDTSYGFCGDDFEWHKSEGACKPTDYIPPRPTDQQSLITFKCVNGQWSPDVTPVECTKNSDCENGEVCDTKIWKCSSLEIGGSQIGSPVPTTQSECESSSWLGIRGQWIVAKETACGFFCNIGLTQATVTEKPYCEYPGKTAIIIAGFVIIAFFMFLILILAMGKSKPKQQAQQQPQYIVEK